jgi:16S rRNA (uracil1498-N3)-methyltransferase
MPQGKSATRMFFPGDLAPGSSCALPPQQAHHATRVLRLEAGDAVLLFNGDGAEYSGVIARVARERVTVEVTGREAVDREPPLAVTLAQGVSSGDRMDYTLQKAVELGVASIQPLSASRSVVKLDAERAERRLAHWRTVVTGACEQSGRNRVPAVAPVMPLSGWLGREPAARGAALPLLLSPRAERRLRDLSRPAGGIELLAGPEGGFAPGEESMALSAGYTAVRLGPRILRTETAAVAALAAIQALWGDF